MEVESFDIIVPTAVLFGFFHVVLTALSKISDDNEDKFHNYYGWTGYCFIIFRIVVIFYFWKGLK